MPDTLLDSGEDTGIFPKVGGSWGREQVGARTSAYLEQRAVKLGIDQENMLYDRRDLVTFRHF